MDYEILLDKVFDSNLKLIEAETPGSIQGLLVDDLIIINRNLNETEKKCVLAEEFAHFLMTAGNILDQQSLSNRKQEKKARNTAIELLIPSDEFIQMINTEADIFELAEHFGVTPEFISAAVSHYEEKYGELKL